jgi:hypothetical protein
MERPIISIHDANGNETQRSMNDEEYAQYLIDVENAQAKETLRIQKEEARQAVITKLSALGLSIDDLAALGL